MNVNSFKKLNWRKKNSLCRLKAAELLCCQQIVIPFPVLFSQTHTVVSFNPSGPKLKTLALLCK